MFSIRNVRATEKIMPCSVLKRDWTFQPSTPWPGAFLHRGKAALFGRRLLPERRTVTPPSPRARWILYFAYLPDATLTPAHCFTLERLARADAGLFVVCALPPGAAVPAELHDLADAVATKGLSGYDFSAYAFGLSQIVEHSPGCDLFVLNDSVLGPFNDIDREFDTARWDFTGYTGQAMIEPHIQSYAFIVKNVDAGLERALRSVLPQTYCYNRYKDVVFQQETRLARVASRHMSVGVKWFSDVATAVDPSFFCAISLLETGFPFLKKSLLHRRPDVYANSAIVELLDRLGHPRL